MTGKTGARPEVRNLKSRETFAIFTKRGVAPSFAPPKRKKNRQTASTRQPEEQAVDVIL